MKKTIYSFFVITMILPFAVSAATFSFTPSSGSFTTEKTFTIDVYVNPGVGEEITTAKISMEFPANLLEVVSFSPEAGWMPLVQSGYDLIDNIKGEMVKTGGFPLRVKQIKKFGTVVFKTKIDGIAKIVINNDSILLDTNNVNKFVSAVGADFIIYTPVSVPASVIVPVNNLDERGVETPSKTNEEKVILKEVNLLEESTTTQDVIGGTTTDQIAAVATSGENGGFWYYILGLFVVLIGGGLLWKKFGQKKSK